MSSLDRTPAAQSRDGNSNISSTESGHTSEVAEHNGSIEDEELPGGTLNPEAPALYTQHSGLDSSQRGINAADYTRIQNMSSGNVLGATLDTTERLEEPHLNPWISEPSNRAARSSIPEWTASQLEDLSIATDPSWKENDLVQPERSDDQAGLELEFNEQDQPRFAQDRSEIHDIMAQFREGGCRPGSMEPASPTASSLPVFQYPPRSSSLDHLQKEHNDNIPRRELTGISSAAQDGTRSFGSISSTVNSEKYSLTPTTSTIAQPPMPEPDPEPDLPFDFNRFHEQLRHRTADPVAGFLRSFLLEFGKKQWMAHQQVKIISDFLSFITSKMAKCDVWRTVSDAEFDNAREGMEKLVTNRLYYQIFSPEIPPVDTTKGRRKAAAIPSIAGRRGQHQEDVERDEVLAQKVRIYGWVCEEHLDIRPFDNRGKKLLLVAQKELSKIKNYKAPRDKIICVLNCCKVIFGALRNAEKDQSADSFIPLLIYTVLKANPDHLVSNVEYILRFRNPQKLSGEAGYYMSSLLGAVQFIENLDRKNLTVNDEEFERNVEAAVSTIAEQNEQEEKNAQVLSSAHLPFNEKSSLSRAEVTARNSTDAERSSPLRAPARPSTETAISDDGEEKAAIAGLLRTIQKPLSTIGRLFSEEPTVPQSSQNNDRRTTASQPAASPRRSPIPIRDSSLPSGSIAEGQISRLADQDAAARQANWEAAEAHKIQMAEHATVVETLSGMFPDLDKDIISDVVRQKDGSVGLAVDACLALSR